MTLLFERLREGLVESFVALERDVACSTSMNAPQPPNPYAPPAVQQAYNPAAAAGPSAVWQQDGAAVCAKGAPWPDRCVRCNEPAQGYRLKRPLYWHPMWAYLLIFAGVLIYVLIALVIRKSAVVHVGLCPRHRASRRNGLLIGWGGALASVATCSMTMEDEPSMIGVGMLGVIVSAFVGILMTRVVRPKRIDDTHAWVRCGQPFVDSLPQVGAGWGTYR